MQSDFHDCARCANACAVMLAQVWENGLNALKTAILPLAQPLHNTFNKKTTIHTTEALAQDISLLYTRYREFVLRVCIRYVQNHDEAEDLTQEVFLKAEKALETFASQSQPSTWLYRIAVNHCLDSLRRKKHQKDVMASYAICMEDDEESVDEEKAPTPMRQILDRLGEGMDNVDRQIVYLRFELGFTHQAIAEVCGISRVAITKRLTKIENKAKELYAEIENTPVTRVAA